MGSRHCRLEHQGPTSDEVGMRREIPRLEHQEPTSDEVSMCAKRRHQGRSVMNCLSAGFDAIFAPLRNRRFWQ